jgi:Tol biopolymer transport system component
MNLAPGTRVGSYEVLAPIGAGGMGEVYRARDTQLKREIALKVLPATVATDTDRLVRFQREAEVLAALNHPNIAQIYGLAESGGVRALAMELVEGQTLAERLARGPVPPAEAIPIAQQLADALDYAHERGIVHRDLKPANVKVRPDDCVVKVLDFGLAKALDSGPGPGTNQGASSVATVTSPAMTRVGVILGTAAYMSPEQARGRPVDKRADVWAFGCVLYEMLTGTRPFDGGTVSDAIAAVLEREPNLNALPAGTPERIRSLIRRCLEKDVRRRLRDIGDARTELDLALAEPSAPVIAPHLTARRRRVSWMAGPAIAVACIVAAVGGWLVGRRVLVADVPTFDRIVRLVSTSAHEFGPVIAPDGKWVAYLSDARGRTDVWVKFIAGGDPVNLTASADLIVQSQDAIGGLAISPDGSQIAFQAQLPSTPQASVGTWVIPAPLGGPARRLLESGKSGMQWSPDGTRLAYVRTGGPLGDALMVADSEGQNEVEIVKRQGARHLHWLRWDAAGEFLYFNYGFQNFNIETTEIYRAPATGGPLEPVVSTARRAVFPFPSPDGRGLFYAANPDSVDLSLWWRDLASGLEARITTGIGDYSTPSVSADGQRLVGTLLDTRYSLQQARVRFDAPTTLERLTDGHSGDLDPAWSPDGRHLAFSSSRTGTRTLWVAGSNLAQATPLTSGSAFDERPVYSPDGRQIAFVSDRGGRRGVWSISPEAGTLRLIAPADIVGAVSWSLDGRSLVFAAPVGDAPGLITLDVASGQASRVPTPSAANAPAWSPREDLIAYVEP